MKANTTLVDEEKARQTLQARTAQDAWTQYCMLRLREKKSPGCHMRDFAEWWDTHIAARRQLAFVFITIEPTAPEVRMDVRALGELQAARKCFAQQFGEIQTIAQVNKILPCALKKHSAAFFIKVSSALSEDELQQIHSRVMRMC